MPPPHEIVVADDGSTDDIEGVVASFGDAVRLLRLPHGGEASAKNAAARAATGDFVVILDADDVFLPGRLAALRDLALAQPELDILTTDAHLEVAGAYVGRCYTPTHRFADEGQSVEILRRNFIFGLAAIRRTSCSKSACSTSRSATPPTGSAGSASSSPAHASASFRAARRVQAE